VSGTLTLRLWLHFPKPRKMYNRERDAHTTIVAAFPNPVKCTIVSGTLTLRLWLHFPTPRQISSRERDAHTTICAAFPNPRSASILLADCIVLQFWQHFPTPVKYPIVSETLTLRFVPHFPIPVVRASCSRIVRRGWDCASPIVHRELHCSSPIILDPLPFPDRLCYLQNSSSLILDRTRNDFL
jgi:hypothetical protein